MQEGHLFFKNTTDPSLIIFLMHCLLSFFPLFYVLEASGKTRIVEIKVFQEHQWKI